MKRCQTYNIFVIAEALEIFPCHVNNVIFFKYYVTLFFIKEMTFAFEILVSLNLYLDLVVIRGIGRLENRATAQLKETLL
jgi:hypothetical protein